MARIRSLSTALGLFSVVAVLLLHAPGIQVARADQHASHAASVDPSQLQSTMQVSSAAPPAAPACGAAPAAVPTQDKMELLMEKMLQKSRIQARADQREDSDRPAVTMLNGRGYNYGAGGQQGLDVGALQRDLQLARKEAAAR